MVADNWTSRLMYICSLTVILGGIRVQNRFSVCQELWSKTCGNFLPEADCSNLLNSTMKFRMTQDAYYLCYHAPGTWRQAVDNCSRHEGKLVSVPVINQTLSVRGAIRLLYNLNMTVWKDVWIGNFVSADDIQIATTGNSHISSQSHLCGTVTIEHYDDQKAFTSLPKYVNCSIDHPPICGYSESFDISSSLMDWNTAHNTCGRDGLYTFSSTATPLGIRCGTVNTSLSYWVNSVQKLQWNDIQTTSDTPNPHSCGSLQYKPNLTAMSPCDEVKPFVCRVDYVLASDSAKDCVLKTESRNPTSNVSPTRTSNTETSSPTGQANIFTVTITPKMNLSHNMSKGPEGITLSGSLITIKPEGETEMNFVDKGLYIGVGIGAFVLAIAVCVLVVMRRRYFWNRSEVNQNTRAPNDTEERSDDPQNEPHYINITYSNSSLNEEPHRYEELRFANQDQQVYINDVDNSHAYCTLNKTK